MKTETKIKLSPKQKEVIRLMREGSELKYDAVYNFFTTKKNKYDYPEISALSNARIIQATRQLNGIRYYHLTELGKTIDIN